MNENIKKGMVEEQIIDARDGCNFSLIIHVLKIIIAIFHLRILGYFKYMCI